MKEKRRKKERKKNGVGERQTNKHTETMRFLKRSTKAKSKLDLART